MRILLTTLHHPEHEPIGGVQSWCRTVSGELSRRGHEVTTWAPGSAAPRHMAEAAVFAHWGATQQALQFCVPSAPLIRLSHGIVPDERGGTAYTSEEVRDHWGGRSDALIIRQPVDTDYWAPGEKRQPLLVHFGYRGALGGLPEIAKARGLQFMRLRNASPDRCREVLRAARVVFATGRAALEAMACGAAVVIADARKYMPPMLDMDPVGAMRRNYSGRGGIEPTPRAMERAIDEAILRGSMRLHVERHHDMRRIVDVIEGALK